MTVGGADDRTRAELARLRDAGPVLSRRLRDALRKAGKDAAGKSQQRIRSAFTSHGGELRAEIAATMTVTPHIRRAGADVVIRSVGRRMPEGKTNLPAYANAGPKWQRWRHPVYGQDRWVSQDWPSARGWFDDTLRGQAVPVGRQLEQALDDAVRELGG